MSEIEKVLTKDPIMRELVDKFGSLDKPSPSTDLFSDILETIVSQQLSVKAARTIWTRFKELVTDVTPANSVLGDLDKLRSVGLSRQKALYISHAAQCVGGGIVDIDSLPNLPDEVVIEKLVVIKGIGRWSAEMILIFSLGREDVFSLGDLGLRTAVSNLYGVDRQNLSEIDKISKRWKPYRSYASRYLWKSLDNQPKVDIA